MQNKFLLTLSIAGFIMEIIFGSFPYWPSAKNRLEELIPINDYTFHDRQFYFTFVILGGFSNILGIISSVKNHHFLFINVIWLSSFCSASFLIKLVWETIFISMQWNTEETIKTTYWPILMRYFIGACFYALQVYVAFRARTKIVTNYKRIAMNNISQKEINTLYENLTNCNTDPEIQRALSHNQSQLNSLLTTIVAKQRTLSVAPSASGWQTSTSFTPKASLNHDPTMQTTILQHNPSQARRTPSVQFATSSMHNAENQNLLNFKSIKSTTTANLQ